MIAAMQLYRRIGIRRSATCALALMCTTACAPLQIFQDPLQTAKNIAAKGNLRFDRVAAWPFTIATFHKGLFGSPDVLTVYIEGDGRAWLTKRRLSPDPTPRDPVGLRLASRDVRASVLYMARPCQYLDEPSRDDCDPKYWSTHRYSAIVVESMNRVVDRAVKKAGARAVAMVGYSGGGALAVLLASRRKDVRSLVTVAGNLDHRKWTALHEVSPLVGSMNPVDVANRLPAELPQLHLSGERDTVVPPEISESFFLHLPERHSALQVVVPEFDHRCCWARDWVRLLSRYPLNAR